MNFIGLEDHQPLLCGEVGEIMDRLKAKDNYLFTIEFEVPTPPYPPPSPGLKKLIQPVLLVSES